MYTPVRRRLPSGKLGPEPTPNPKRIKARYKIWIVVILVVVGYGIYVSNKAKHHSVRRSDLVLVPTSTRIAPGRAGVVEVHIRNNGPAALDDDNVTFTITSPSRLIITGRGRVKDSSGEIAFPDAKCAPRRSGHAMTCRAGVSVGVGHQLPWRIPVRVVAGTPPNTRLRLTVSALVDATRADPRRANSTGVGYTVVAAGTAPVPPRTVTPPRAPSTHPPTTSHARRAPGSHAVRDTLAPLTIALWIIVGLVALIVAVLVLVAARQRRHPLTYIPPRRDKNR